jgi:hypothetical protein
VHVGEGLIRDRLAAHRAKAAAAKTEQGRVFRGAAPLEASWVLDATWLIRQRQELETDLIAGHLLATGQVPPAQFLG